MIFQTLMNQEKERTVGVINMMIVAAFTLAIGVLQMICLAAVFWGLVELRAMQKSTHSIQYVPVDQSFQSPSEPVQENVAKELFDNVG